MTGTSAGAASGRPRHARYDVVVVGSRVAGAATAMLLARCGYQVLMVDRSTRGSDTASTHTLLRTAVLQLKRWGLLGAVVDSDTPAISRVTLGFGPDLTPIDLSADFGIDALFAPRRTLLDPLLTDAAEDAGVEFCDRTRVMDLLTDPSGRVSGVIVSSDSQRISVDADFVVGADGASSRVAELAGSSMYVSYPATNAIRYAYYSGIETDGVHFQFTPGVTAGLIPTNGDVVCVYLGLPIQQMRQVRTDREFGDAVAGSHRSLDRSLVTAQRISRFWGTSGLPGFLRQPSGPGWALVGDAGYCKDPVSAHGISSALRDAELCARAIERALGDPGDEADAFEFYRTTRDGVSRRMLEQTTALASYAWTADVASQLMRGVSDSVKVECQMLIELGDWNGMIESGLAGSTPSRG